MIPLCDTASEAALLNCCRTQIAQGREAKHREPPVRCSVKFDARSLSGRETASVDHDARDPRSRA